MTPFQLDASANAPCTSTIVGLASVCSARWPVVFTGDLLQCADAGSHDARRDNASLLPSTIAPRAVPSRPWTTLAGTLVRRPQEAAPRRSSAAAGWPASGPERSG